MPSRLSEHGRVRLVALGALALACWVASASAFAQEASSDALGLRGDSAAPAAPMDGPAAASVGQFPLDEANPAARKKPRPKKGSKSPPSLGIYPGAQRLGLRGGPPEAASGQTPSPTIAAIPPSPSRRRPAVDDKPFDPVGVGVGDLKLTPYVEEDFGWASNPALAAGPQKGSAFETTEGGLSLQSDWSRSDLHGVLKGGYTDYFADHQANLPYGSGALGRSARRDARSVVRRRGTVQRQRADARFARRGVGRRGRRERTSPGRDLRRHRSEARKNSAI